jgi:hypothetical protein
MSPETLTILKTFVEDVRENGKTEGVIYLGGPGKKLDWVDISLARFQSYRGRTTAALLEELEDLVVGAEYLHFQTNDILVHLEAS